MTISPQRIPVKKNRILALGIHFILKAIFMIVRPFNFKIFPKAGKLQPNKIKRLLIIRTDGLGDLVMSTPAFRALRKCFPRSCVTLLAASYSKELVETIPVFDEVSYFDSPWIVKEKKNKIRSLYKDIKKIRRNKYDLAIDLRGDFRNNILMYFCGITYRMGFNITGCEYLLTDIIPVGKNHHAVNTGLSLIKYLNIQDKEGEMLSLWITKEDREFSDNFFAEKGIDDKKLIVLIHPGAKWNGRRWEAKGYGQVADRLIKEYKAIIILAEAPGEPKLTQQISDVMTEKAIIAGKTSIRKLCALIERSDLFIGPDSGPIHMASAMGTRVIALMGPARREAVGPYGDGNIVVTKQDEFACSPCAQTICKRPEYSCMKAITAEDVWRAVTIQIGDILSKEGVVREKRKRLHPGED